jgi:hypothetical protein
LEHYSQYKYRVEKNAVQKLGPSWPKQSDHSPKVCYPLHYFPPLAHILFPCSSQHKSLLQYVAATCTVYILLLTFSKGMLSSPLFPTPCSHPLSLFITAQTSSAICCCHLYCVHSVTYIPTIVTSLLPLLFLLPQHIISLDLKLYSPLYFSSLIHELKVC